MSVNHIENTFTELETLNKLIEIYKKYEQQKFVFKTEVQKKGFITWNSLLQLMIQLSALITQEQYYNNSQRKDVFDFCLTQLNQAFQETQPLLKIGDLSQIIIQQRKQSLKEKAKQQNLTNSITEQNQVDSKSKQEVEFTLKDIDINYQELKNKIDCSEELINREISLQDVYDLNIISIQGLNQVYRIQTDTFKLRIIKKFYYQDWKNLISSLNLIQKKNSMSSYQFTQNEDISKVETQMISFINQINYCALYLIKYSQSALNQNSIIKQQLNKKLIETYQFEENCYLISKDMDEKELNKWKQYIINNYRGIVMYYNNGKSVLNQTQDQDNELTQMRSDFLTSFYKEKLKNFGFNSQFQQDCFFLEMNFSKMKEEKEFNAIFINKFVVDYMKNLQYMKIRYQCEDIEDTFKLALQEMNQKIGAEPKILVRFYQNFMLILGQTGTLSFLFHSLLNIVTKQQVKSINKIEIILNKENYDYSINKQYTHNFDSIIQQLIDSQITFQKKDNNYHIILDNPKITSLKNLANVGIFLSNYRDDANNDEIIQNSYKKIQTIIKEYQTYLPLNLDHVNFDQNSTVENSYNVYLTGDTQNMHYYQSQSFYQVQEYKVGKDQLILEQEKQIKDLQEENSNLNQIIQQQKLEKSNTNNQQISDSLKIIDLIKNLAFQQSKENKQVLLKLEEIKHSQKKDTDFIHLQPPAELQGNNQVQQFGTIGESQFMY